MHKWFFNEKKQTGRKKGKRCRQGNCVILFKYREGSFVFIMVVIRQQDTKHKGIYSQVGWIQMCPDYLKDTAIYSIVLELGVIRE